MVLWANASFAQPKKIGALKINTTIKIDGALDELIWAQSDTAVNFIQLSPQLGAAASNNSRVSICLRVRSPDLKIVEIINWSRAEGKPAITSLSGSLTGTGGRGRGRGTSTALIIDPKTFNSKCVCGIYIL